MRRRPLIVGASAIALGAGLDVARAQPLGAAMARVGVLSFGSSPAGANPDPKTARVAEIQLRGGVATGAVLGRVLESGGDINAHNTFADPARIALKSVSPSSVKGGLLTHTFPAASVTRFDIPLA